MPDAFGSYVFVIRDTTALVQWDRQSRRFGRISELTSNLVIITDSEDRIEWVNPAFEKRSGWSLAQLRGQRTDAFLPSDFTERDPLPRVGDVPGQAEPLPTERLCRDRHGAEYWVSEDIQPLHDAEGRLESVVRVQTDITDLKSNYMRELQIRATAIEAASDGIALSDETGHYVYMNPAHRRMFGIAADEDIRTLSWVDLTAPEQRERFAAEHWETLRTAGTWSGASIGLHRDDRKLDLDVALTLTEGNDLICVARDVSSRRREEAERARLREELQLAQRRETVAHLAAGVGHDLNNLIAVVSGTVALMEEGCSEDEALASGLLRIARAMTAAGELVSGLGHLARPQTHHRDIGLCEVIGEAVDLLGSARISAHDIRVETPRDCPKVWADRTDILQVILNLAINACEAGDAGANRVVLRVATTGTDLPIREPDAGTIHEGRSYALFSISDTGRGIAPEVRARLFEPYVTTKGRQGTGLGLPIVASILLNNDAAVWYDSTPGAGTIVTVAWPDSGRTSSTIDASRPASHRLGSLSGHNVMVVDDKIDVAEVLSEILEADGAIAIAISDPEEATRLLLEESDLWSAVVTDLEMPRMKGTDIADAATRARPSVPCILVTALPYSTGWDRSVFRHVLAKPVDPHELVACVRSAAEASVADRRSDAADVDPAPKSAARRF
ncbi:MAG: PAS domain S-box protein [Rhodobacteraceae bacterium]|nr:PAS domain S-box protein [Paracoccaceae bacterium]